MATKRGRGRPAFKPTAAMRKRVSIAAGGGMTHEAIAIALGISRPTLDKYFSVELSESANVRRLEVLESLYAAAKRGNVSAGKAYLANQAQFAPLPAAAGAGESAGQEKPERPAAPLGKKEAANEHAKTAQAGTSWEGLLPGATPLQ